MTLLQPLLGETARRVHHIRWDEARVLAGPDAIALSVADMDFAAPESVIADIVSAASQGSFHYTSLSPAFYQSVSDWFAARHGWEFAPDQIVAVGRVVEALPAVLRDLTEPGAKIIVPMPAYSPIPNAITAIGREVVPWDLRLVAGYTFDFEALAALLDQGAQALVLTNPHNPTGRVWTVEELTRVAKLAEAYGVLVISDEVHADLLRTGQRFTPYLTCADENAHAISLVSPGKTFNMAGLETANMIVPNPDLRASVRTAVEAAGTHNPRFFTETATIAAYQNGAPWLDELLGLLDHHVELVHQELAQNLPVVRLIEPEGTYLGWLDLTGLGRGDQEVQDALIQSGLVLSPGTSFGRGGCGFMRMNLAVPTATLTKGIDRLTRALQPLS